MFDIGFWELSLIAVIALLVLGPDRLPRVARTAGLWVSKMKAMVAEVKSNIDEELRMEELNALKQAGEQLKGDLETTQKELRDAGSTFQTSVEEASNVANSIGDSVDIATAIKESAPKTDEKPVDMGGASTAEKPAKGKTKRKSKRKVNKKTQAAEKKVVKTNGNATKKNKKFAKERKESGGAAQVQATSKQGSDIPNQDPPDRSV